MKPFESISLCSISSEEIDQYLTWEKNKGTSHATLIKLKCYVSGFYDWTEEQWVSKDMLVKWRESLEHQGYSQATIQNYIKGINRYLEYQNCPELKFKKGKKKEIAGQTFGYLTVIECTEKKDRNNYIWKCRCKCGNEVELPAVRLLSGNTNSCGCIRQENLKKANMYIEKTSIRQVLDSKVESTRAESGYTGVTRKRDKWQAYITYKGRRYSLGCYENIEDAVQARKKAKEKVKEDAIELIKLYQHMHQEDLKLPKKGKRR